jgi:hypothetical protein
MKQNAEIFATQDYYEIVCFDRVRRSTAKYDELRSTWRNRRVRFVGPHISLRFTRIRNAACGPDALREGGCNKRATRGATAHYRHDRDRVSVTVRDVTS